MAHEKEEFEQGDTAEYALPTMNELSIEARPGLHHKERLRLRDFASIVAFLSEREIEELQVAIDERRQARAHLADIDATAARPGSTSGVGRSSAIHRNA